VVDGMFWVMMIIEEKRCGWIFTIIWIKIKKEGVSVVVCDSANWWGYASYFRIFMSIPQLEKAANFYT
jgi:hypothetical protein